MQQYRDLLQQWLDFYDTINGEELDIVKRTREVIKNKGFRCTCERCTGIPDADSFYKE